MSILNEDFKSEFFKKINKKLKTDFKKDNEIENNFIIDATYLLKEAVDFALKSNNYGVNKEKQENIFNKIREFKEKYNLSSSDVDYLNRLIGKDYYGNPSKFYSFYNLKYIKEKFISLLGGDRYNSSAEIRTNKSKPNNDSHNSFKFISNIIGKKSWSGDNINLATVTDEQIEKVSKIPKLITERSPLYNDYLFWFISDDPDSKELLDDDRIVGISKGSNVYYPIPEMYHGKRESYKIKDIADKANKLYSLKINQEEANKLSKLRFDRRDKQNIWKYVPYKYDMSSAPEYDEFPDPNNINSPNYIKVENRIYMKSNVGEVLSSEEFSRDAQYKYMIEQKIQDYKTRAENIRIKKSEETDIIDTCVDLTIKEIHKYLANNSIKTGDLRNIYRKTDKMLETYEDFLRNKESLKRDYSSWRKSDMNKNRTETIDLCHNLLKLINSEIILNA